MKKSILIVAITAMVFASCEKDEVTSEELNTIQKEEVTDDVSKSSGLYPVYRSYAGAPYTIYSYRVKNAGSYFGSSQGTSFKLGVINSRSGLPSGTRQLFLLQEKNNRDFMLTTSTTERNNIMGTRAWYDRSYSSSNEDLVGSGRIYEKVYIHTGPGNGRVKLYRFYDGTGQSIHLFTTNYNEGASRGYRLEGVVGYVYR